MLSINHGICIIIVSSSIDFKFRITSIECHYQCKLALRRSLLISIYLVFAFVFLYEVNISLSNSCHKSYFDNEAFAHMPVSNASRIQQWTDTYNGISAQFVYEPERPIIDTFTELKFSIQNLTTGNHISENEDAIARVVVTNGQRLFMFENISVDDGHFSVKYLFPDDGTHQVITRLDTNDSSSASSFNVFVPHQTPPNILNPFPSSTTNANNSQQIGNIAILVGIISGIAVVTIFQIRRRQGRRF